MKTTITSTLVSLFVTSAVLYGILHLPLSWFTSTDTQLGATVTTISSSDQLSNFPAIYNANLASMNAAKLEISAFAATTSMPNLASVGTITTGTWNATAIAANRGGTGLTSYAAGDILYASGASTLAKLAKGTDGQLLTLSSGVPAWGSPTLDLAIDYTWTGHHIFSSLFATRASSTHATTTTLSVNGLNYRWPSSHSASSSVLSNDGGGSLTWLKTNTLQTGFFLHATTVALTGANVTGVTFTHPLGTIPAGALGGSGAVRVKFVIYEYIAESSRTGSTTVMLGDTAVCYIDLPTSNATLKGPVEIVIANTGTGTQVCAGSSALNHEVTTSNQWKTPATTKWSNVDTTVALPVNIRNSVSAGGGAAQLNLNNVYVEVLGGI
jgi:hypothetical protein